MSDRMKDFSRYGKGCSFFSNRACEYYPCHKVAEGEELNCLFCYCPLYMLGRSCGGNYVYLPDGTKDCSECLIPHRRENYGYITGKFRKIVEEMAQAERKKEEEKDRGEINNRC